MHGKDPVAKTSPPGRIMGNLTKLVFLLVGKLKLEPRVVFSHHVIFHGSHASDHVLLSDLQHLAVSLQPFVSFFMAKMSLSKVYMHETSVSVLGSRNREAQRAALVLKLPTQPHWRRRLDRRTHHRLWRPFLLRQNSRALQHRSMQMS